MHPAWPPRSQKAVQSRSSDLHKQPWKDLPPLTGIVETIFMRPVFLGESLVPFRALDPETGLIPYDGRSLLQGSDDRIERYPGFANWWRKAEAAWETHKGERNGLSLLDRFDYHGGLREQFPMDPIRVLYSTSGSSLVGVIVDDPRAVIDHKAYWCAVATRDGGFYLCSILNSATIEGELRPLQSVGAFGPCDIHKYPWFAPVPTFDPVNPLHQEMVSLAKDDAELVAELTDIEGMDFKKGRREIRTAIAEAGIPFGCSLLEAESRLKQVIGGGSARRSWIAPVRAGSTLGHDAADAPATATAILGHRRSCSGPMPRMAHAQRTVTTSVAVLVASCSPLTSVTVSVTV